MSEDFFVPPLKNTEIAERAYAWREALGVSAFVESPEIVSLVENELPKIFPEFSLIIEKSRNLDNVEAYTEFTPPKIVVRENVYFAALDYDGRARWTFAHELGHLVLHDSAVPLNRAPETYKSKGVLPPYASAEKQADKFAAHFLMPDWIVKEYSSAQDLMQACKVSFEAARIRFETVERLERRKLPDLIKKRIQEI